MLIDRPTLLGQLQHWQDHDVVKIITGVRRAGKSTLLDLFQQSLTKQGVPARQVIRLNLEDLSTANFRDYQQLHDYILQLVDDCHPYYILIDEIQNLPNWQKAVNSLYLHRNLDLYLTGSNAYLLSGELATLLSGRYITIPVLPLSFGEYTHAHPDITDRQQLYGRYTTLGAFPYVSSLTSSSDVGVYIRHLYDTILLKDIIARRKIQDHLMLERVVLFLLDNIGNLTSSHSLANTLRANGYAVSVNTVDSYLSALTYAYLFYKVGRYDIKGKQYLKTLDKYYVVDPSLRYFLLRQQTSDSGRLLENIVYLELLRRDWQVYVGQWGRYEVDFVAVRGAQVEYYQVSESVREPSTFEREMRPLHVITDNYPKTLLTLDYNPEQDFQGVKQKFVLDWLLNAPTSC